MVFIWVGLFRWSKKTDSAKYLVGANFIIYLFYILLLFRPLFIEELGSGGGGFAAGMYIMILSPIHLTLTFLAVVIFNKVFSSQILGKGLLIIGLPAAALVLGFFIANRKNTAEEINSQLSIEKINRELKAEEIKNIQTAQQFESFLVQFSSDSAFQKAHTNLPLAVFFLNENLEVDTVDHYYDHNWEPFRFPKQNLLWVINEWEYIRKKSSEKVISRTEEDFRVNYNFKFNKEWELFDIKKVRITSANRTLY